MDATASTLSEGLPIGQRGPRGQMLLQLKRAQPLTARELAQRLGLSLNAARHHLKELEAEGLVLYDRSHRGVGAPVFLYRLSPTGDALFPRGYDRALTRLLEQVVAREGREAAVALLRGYFAELGHRLRQQLDGAGPEGRLRIVARALSEEGYMAEEGYPAEGSGADAEGTLTERNCALASVAQRFPEMCAAEAEFLGDVLGAEVDRREHILSGCSACEYRVRFRQDTKEVRS